MNGKNYAGHRPRPLDHPVLTAFVEERLAADLADVDGALVVPLGQAVEGCLDALVKGGHLDPARCLFGLPHPSGANPGRRKWTEFAEATAARRTPAFLLAARSVGFDDRGRVRRPDSDLRDHCRHRTGGDTSEP